MRALVLLLCFAAPALADNTPPPSDRGSFGLELSWSRQEQSMDSNGESESFTLRGDQLSWTWSYSGYHPDRNFVRNKKKTVKVKDPAALRALVVNHKLDETRQVSLGLAQHQSYTIILKTTVKGKTSTLTASGDPPNDPPEDWRTLEQLHSTLRGLVTGD